MATMGPDRLDSFTYVDVEVQKLRVEQVTRSLISQTETISYLMVSRGQSCRGLPIFAKILTTLPK
jgi:hypothetical protein